MREQRQRGGSGQSTRGLDSKVRVRVKMRFKKQETEV